MCEQSMGQDALDDMLVESAGMTEDTWVTVDGKHIKYEDLTDSHLHNIVAYLQSHTSTAGYMIDGLLLECDRRGFDRIAKETRS